MDEKRLADTLEAAADAIGFYFKLAASAVRQVGETKGTDKVTQVESSMLHERDLKEDFLINYMDRQGWLPDHSFTFPDGETWYAKTEKGSGVPLDWKPAHTGFHPEETLKTQNMPEEWWKGLSNLAKGRIWQVAQGFSKVAEDKDQPWSVRDVTSGET